MGLTSKYIGLTSNDKSIPLKIYKIYRIDVITYKIYKLSNSYIKSRNQDEKGMYTLIYKLSSFNCLTKLIAYINIYTKLIRKFINFVFNSIACEVERFQLFKSVV